MFKKTILIADDDRDFLKIEENFLTHAGYNVICAQDAYRALHLALTELPNLLLLDINMPAGNGLSVHQRIRKSPAFHDTPVIYLTGERSDAVKEKARTMGAFSVLYKPFEFDVLLTEVKAAIHESDRRMSQMAISTQGDSNPMWSLVVKKS